MAQDAATLTNNDNDNDNNDETVDMTAAPISTDPLDFTNLIEYQDEAALINELLSSDVSDSIGGDHVRDDQLPLSSLDTKLARLLGNLEHACQDTSAQVERAIDEVSRSVPRLTFDLQLMRENVVLLRYTLDSIRKRSAEAISASETSNVMRRLKVLDTIKSRMEASRDVLREAEAWSSLESEVTALVQERSFVKAAERLAEANKSMVVFQNSPEYEQRRNLMVSLQNGLEAGLSASLVAAITARDMEACRNHHAIFRQIQRETEFRNYYFGSRRAHLVKEWQNANLSDCSGSGVALSGPAPASPFAVYLPTFFASLQSTIDDERTYIPAIFNDPTDTLSAFLQTTLDSLSPSFPQRISDLSNSHGPRLLLELIKIYHSTEECAVAIERSINTLQSSLSLVASAPANGVLPSTAPATPGGPTAISPNGMPAHAPATPGPGPASSLAKQRMRRQSKALSISRRHSRAGTYLFAPSSGSGSSSSVFAQHGGSADSANGSTVVADDGQLLLPDGAPPAKPILGWETTLFEPFLDWQAEYADLEARLLRAELSRVTNGQDAIAFLLGGSLSSSTSRNAGSGVAAADEYDNDDDDAAAAAASGLNRAKEAAKLLLDQTGSVVALAEEALGRCMALTHGYGAAGYVEAVDGTLKTFFIKEKDTLLRAKDSRMRKRRQEIRLAASGSTSGSGGGSGGGGAHAEGDTHLDYSQADLASFQMALRLLEACTAIHKRIDQLEARVTARLVDVTRLLKEARADPTNQVVPGTTRGALALLWQSTLNSAALTSLLESVERSSSNKGQSSASSAGTGAGRQVQVQLPLFQQARSASSEIARAAQLFLHEAILLPLLTALDGYASLAVWVQPSSARPESRGAFDLHIPTFSLSPSEIITRIGEGFLNLPAMFEMYAEDEALGVSLDTLPDLDPEMVRSLRREAQLHTDAAQHAATGAGAGAPLPSPHVGHQAGAAAHPARHASRMSIVDNEFLPVGSNSGSSIGAVDSPARPPRVSPTLGTHSAANPLSSASIGSAHHHHHQQQQSSQAWSTETVISAWLSSLTRSVLLHLAKVVVPSITSLSKHGQEQLAADLGYISNVAKALDVEVEQVEKWRIALEAATGGKEGRPAQQSTGTGTGTGTGAGASAEGEAEEPPAAEVDQEVADMLRRMRSAPPGGRPQLQTTR